MRLWTRIWLTIGFSLILAIIYLMASKNPTSSKNRLTKREVALPTEATNIKSSTEATIIKGEITHIEPDQSLAPRTLLYQPKPSHCENRTLFVGVHVRVTAFDVRQEWRDSFGKLREKYNFCLVFGLGLPSKQSDFAKLRNESLHHKDLLIGDFMDTYKNLTHKQLMLLRYFNEELKEVPLFLKIDDDVAVNLEKMQTILSNASNPNPTILCHVWQNSKVFRKNHKSAISRKQYAPAVWPNFCSGMAYIFNQKAATILLEQVQYEHWLHLDDVFITGILAKRAKIRHVQMRQFYSVHANSRDGFLNGGKIFQLTKRQETKRLFEIANKL